MAMAIDTADPYDQAAFSGLWQNARVANFTRGVYSATISQAPVVTSELILPPHLYFGPYKCYNFRSEFILGVAGAAAQVEGATV
jgi:hypothetical protein